MKENFQFKLEKHPTRSTVDSHVNGSLTVIWRDWDHILKNKEWKKYYLKEEAPKK